MVEGRRVDGDRAAPKRRLTVREAASELGTTSEGVRSRIKRGTLQAERESGRVWVILQGTLARPGAAPPRPDDTQPGDQPGDRAGDRTELVDELRARVSSLERQLDLERDANRENRRLLAAALERIPALEPPEGPESASEPVATTETPAEPAEQEPHKEESSPPQGQDSSDSTLREGAQQ
jgi:hypothetical protein